MTCEAEMKVNFFHLALVAREIICLRSMLVILCGIIQLQKISRTDMTWMCLLCACIVVVVFVVVVVVVVIVIVGARGLSCKSL